jgi:hypothetical protein
MFELLLERLAAALDAAGIPYMVIGGQAVLVHGEPRLTQDIDVTLGVDLDRLGDALAAAAAAGLAPLVDPEDFTRRTMVLPCVDAASRVRVDMIFSFSDYERRAISRAILVRMGARDVRFAAVEDLVIHKIVAGRARDLEDVRALLRRNPRSDIEYVRHVLEELGTALGEPLRQRFDGLARDERT